MEIDIPTKDQLDDWIWPDTEDIFYIKGPINQMYLRGTVIQVANPAMKLAIKPYLKVDFPVEIGKYYQFAGFNWIGVEADKIFCVSYITTKEIVGIDNYLQAWLDYNITNPIYKLDE